MKLCSFDAAASLTAKASSAPKQCILQESFTRGEPYDKKTAKWREITKAVAYHIAKDMVLVATVAQDGFKKFLRTMDPRYNLPNRNFSEKVLPEMYTTLWQKLTARLATVKDFAVTTDMWSSRTCEPYMSLTVHFI